MPRKFQLNPQSFSIDDFVRAHLEREAEVELEAEVNADGEHYVISPADGIQGTVYRIHRSYIRMPIKREHTNGAMLIGVKRKAPCLRLTAGVAEDFLFPEREAHVTVKRATVELGATGKGTLAYAGKTVPCLGKKDFPYTKDLTVRGEVGVDKFEEKYSNEFGVTMYWAILIMGNRGVYIHEGAIEGSSAGCIHLAAPTAREFYDWVDGPTRIQISYPW